MSEANFDTRKKQESDTRDSSGWSASQYNKTASFVYSTAFIAPVLELLNAQPGERILDVGCGSGEVTLLLQKIVEQKARGMVVGTDFSESMVTGTAFQSERDAKLIKIFSSRGPNQMESSIPFSLMHRIWRFPKIPRKFKASSMPSSATRLCTGVNVTH